MKGESILLKLIRILILALLMISIPLSIKIAYNAGINEATNDNDLNYKISKISEEVNDITNGNVDSSKAYNIEIWQNGNVKVITTQEYINQLSNDTIIISNKDLDSVIEEIKVSIDGF